MHLLFYFAAGCLLASLATAPGQLYLGKLYYIKDAGMILCFLILAVLAMMRNDKVAMLLVAFAGVPILMFAPAVPKDETASTALNIMWVLKWTVSAQLGILVWREGMYKALVAVACVLLAILCVDGLIGAWEIRTQGFFFQMSKLDETAAGVEMVKQEHVGEMLRVLSIHRSGGDFGNAMAAGMLVCGFILLVCRRIWVRLLVAPLFVLCMVDLYFSTVRSFLIGAVAGVAALLCHLLAPRVMGRISTQMIVGLIAACLFFSWFNIIPVVVWVSQHLLANSDIGNVDSSYMRLDTWDDVFRDIRGAPAVTVIGGPLAAALSLNAPASEICDNVYLWMFYHTGLFGLIAFLACLPMPLAVRADPRSRALYFAAATQLLVTGIFTDSLFYFSSLILFLALGLILGEPRPAPKPAFLEAQEQAAQPENSTIS